MLSTVFDCSVLDIRPGSVTLRVSGSKAASAFASESGGLRWQRVPPTEKRGRVHTSTITVAVLPEPTSSELVLHAKDLEEKTCRGSGAGGQHRNKTDSAVIITHIPTGVSVRCESERSQHQNRETALALLRARIHEARKLDAESARARDRKTQVGSGMRGDKIRTIRCQDGIVTDHVLGKQWTYKAYSRGEW